MEFVRQQKGHLPRPIRVEFPDLGLLNRVEEELRNRALTDADSCAGYFPDQTGVGIQHDLPACFEFASLHPLLPLDGRCFGFSFLRMSLIRQPSLNGMHLDDNVLSGLCVEPGAAGKAIGQRVILNLSIDDERSLRYSTQDPETMIQEDVDGRTVYYPIDESVHGLHIATREQAVVSGIVFCATHVLHGGEDTDAGHFIASYGMEDIGSTT